MSKLRAIFLIGIISILSFNVMAAMNDIVGEWTTIDDTDNKPRGIVQITEKNGVYAGKIIEVFKRPGDVGMCINCPGEFKDKPIKGIVVFWGLKKINGNKWSGGHVLDPKSGHVYRLKLTLSEGGKELVVRGYLGLSILGRTQIWHRREADAKN